MNKNFCLLNSCELQGSKELANEGDINASRKTCLRNIPWRTSA